MEKFIIVGKVVEVSKEEYIKYWTKELENRKSSLKGFKSKVGRKINEKSLFIEQKRRELAKLTD